MSWVKAAEYVAHDTPDFIFELEEFRNGADQMLFVHLTVRNWTKEVLKQLRHEFNVFRQCVTCPLYAVAGEDASERWENFVSFFGFKHLTDVVCENGEPRKLFWHPPINNNGNLSNVRSVAAADAVAAVTKSDCAVVGAAAVPAERV